jgi:ubiquinone/menaquinone biosynthesis C-methylase UbiE
MEKEHGLQRWLKSPLLYNFVQNKIGGNALRRRFIEAHVRAKPGDKVVDIGCGPGQIRPWLPNVQYVGLDVNPAYIASAQRKHGHNGIFVLGDTKSLWNDSRFSDADIVIGLGILHHLNDDEAASCLAFARHVLKKEGRFVCLEACWIPNQDFLSRYIMSMDRGQNIRTEESYRRLAESVFQDVKTWIDRKPMRIPYVTVVLECQN